MKYIFLLSCFVHFSVAKAQTPVYDAASIPESLKKNADVVKRFEQIDFEVKDIDKASYRVHQVYTVLNKDGASTLFFQEYTNKLMYLEEAEIRTYNENGTPLNKYKKKDLVKQASTDGLVDDGNYYYLEVPAPSYPITVEFKYEITFTGTLVYPPYFIASPGEAVQYSTYTAKIPITLDLRYKQQKIKLTPSVQTEGANKIYRWETRNTEARLREPGSATARFTSPMIVLAPNKFKHFNTYGDLSTWKSFGEWGHNLFSNLDNLSDERKLFFKSLVKDAKGDREKARVIYNYLQKNFRYVSIQIGIGGVKPFSSQFTDDKKYGDCKALSLYMCSALGAVGIKSHVALINANYNQEPVDPEFPSNQFNHAILCIPQQKDSIWLECTSNSAEFGILGSFTENRNALLITEQGGKLVATPKSSSKNNCVTIFTNVDILGDGSGITNSFVSGNGEYKELMNTLKEAKRDDQKKIIVNQLGFRQPDDFSIEFKKQEQPNAEIKLAIEKVPQFTAGSKMFLSSRIHHIIGETLPKCENRRNDFYFHYPYDITDTTVYKMPEGYLADALPKSREIKSDYGSYSCNFWFDQEKRQVYSVARFILNYHIIPADKYQSVKSFIDEVASAEGQKIVIKKG